MPIGSRSKDLEFLREMQLRMERSGEDRTELEFVQTMIADWIDELAAAPARAELLEWLDAEATKPDTGILQLLWIQDEDGHCDWDAGWWSGEEWLLAESGGSVAGKVLFYARPEGPDQ